MANSFHASTHAKIQTLINGLTAAAPAGNVNLDLRSSAGFTLVVKVSPDGQTVSFETTPTDQGQNNTIGASGAALPFPRRGAVIINGRDL